jgi:hypothetical protein
MTPLRRALILALSGFSSYEIGADLLQSQKEQDCSNDSCKLRRQNVGDDEVSLLQASVGVHGRGKWLEEFLDVEVPDTKRPSKISGCKGFDCIRQYVALPDDSYHWKDTGYRIRGRGSSYDSFFNQEVSKAHTVEWTGYVLNMTSQTWRATEVTYPKWWHTLIVVVPANRRHNQFASLQLEFGVNVPKRTFVRFDNHVPPDAVEEGESVNVIDEHNLGQELTSLTQAAQGAAFLAVRTGAIAATLLNLPNGYTQFNDDPTHLWRSADTLRGYTYADFLLHPEEPEVLHELPVAKAVVRAMDTITEFVSKLPSSDSDVNETEIHFVQTKMPVEPDKQLSFAVSGNSKLGTATMVAAALDDRVQVAAPGGVSLDIIPTEYPKIPKMYVEIMDNLADSKKMLDVSIHAKGKKWHDVYMSEIFESVNQNPKANEMHAIVDPGAWLSLIDKPILYHLGSSDSLIGSTTLSFTERVTKATSKARVNFHPNAKHDYALWHGLMSTAAFISGHIQQKGPPPEIVETGSFEEASLEVHQVTDHRPFEVKQWLTFDHDCANKPEGPPCPSWQSHDLEELPDGPPGSHTWLMSLKHLKPEEKDKVMGLFVTLTYEWPEPDSKFTVSSNLYSKKGVELWSNPLAKDMVQVAFTGHTL